MILPLTRGRAGWGLPDCCECEDKMTILATLLCTADRLPPANPFVAGAPQGRLSFCNAHVADSFLICAPRGPFARLHFVSPGQLGSAALRLVFPGQMFHGSVEPATLHESRPYISVIPVSRSPERSRRGSRGIAPRPRGACSDLRTTEAALRGERFTPACRRRRAIPPLRSG